MSENIITLSDSSFEADVLQSQQLVLVDYWATWCGPCKAIAPTLEEIAQEYKGRMTVAKLNIDDNPTIAPRYGVRGIPTLMFFKNGRVVATKVGALAKSAIVAIINQNL